VTKRPLGKKKDVMSYLRCCERKVGSLMANGTLPYKKIGGMVRFDMDAVERAMQKLEHKSLLLRDEDNTSN
jgi:hypothetical protein